MERLRAAPHCDEEYLGNPLEVRAMIPTHGRWLAGEGGKRRKRGGGEIGRGPWAPYFVKFGVSSVSPVCV